jgi:hypothetical protein
MLSLLWLVRQGRPGTENWLTDQSAVVDISDPNKWVIIMSIVILPQADLKRD